MYIYIYMCIYIGLFAGSGEAARVTLSRSLSYVRIRGAGSAPTLLAMVAQAACIGAKDADSPLRAIGQYVAVCCRIVIYMLQRVAVCCGQGCWLSSFCDWSFFSLAFSPSFSLSFTPTHAHAWSICSNIYTRIHTCTHTYYTYFCTCTYMYITCTFILHLHIYTYWGAYIRCFGPLYLHSLFPRISLSPLPPTISHTHTQIGRNRVMFQYFPGLAFCWAMGQRRGGCCLGYHHCPDSWYPFLTIHVIL